MVALSRPVPTLARIPVLPARTVARAVAGAASPLRWAFAVPATVVPVALRPLRPRPERGAAATPVTVAAAVVPGRRTGLRRAPRRRRVRVVRRLLALRPRRPSFALPDRWAAAGSRGSTTSAVSFLSAGSVASVASAISVVSAGSILSTASVCSILSFGSAGSILSIGSAGSILSIGSAGSILSIGSAGTILAIGEGPRSGAGDATDGRHLAPARLLHGTATVIGATAFLAAATRR